VPVKANQAEVKSRWRLILRHDSQDYNYVRIVSLKQCCKSRGRNVRNTPPVQMCNIYIYIYIYIYTTIIVPVHVSVTCVFALHCREMSQ